MAFRCAIGEDPDRHPLHIQPFNRISAGNSLTHRGFLFLSCGFAQAKPPSLKDCSLIFFRETGTPEGSLAPERAKEMQAHAGLFQSSNFWRYSGISTFQPNFATIFSFNACWAAGSP